MIECDQNGRPILIKGTDGKSYIKGPDGEMLECD
jgi:hypothetical protein